MKDKSIKYKVSVLDLEALREGTFECLLDNGSVTKHDKINTLCYGIVEKNGKHYLLNTEGTESIEALEDKRGEILWFRTTLNEDGSEKSVECYPFMSTHFYYFELMQNVIIKEVIPFDEFISTFKNKPDENIKTRKEFLSEKLVLVE